MGIVWVCKCICCFVSAKNWFQCIFLLSLYTYSVIYCNCIFLCIKYAWISKLMRWLSKSLLVVGHMQLSGMLMEGEEHCYVAMGWNRMGIIWMCRYALLLVVY